MEENRKEELLIGSLFIIVKQIQNIIKDYDLSIVLDCKIDEEKNLERYKSKRK